MHKILFTLFVLVIFYGVYNNYKRAKSSKSDVVKHCNICQNNSEKLHNLKQELRQINTVQYVKKYIVDVINHGSLGLGFKGGVMEGGYASFDDAPKIACYVLSLSGKICPNGYEKDAPMFFTSICGGCHGDDGKGLGGSYPDLTRKKLLGIEKREQFLRQRIYILENENLNHEEKK